MGLFVIFAQAFDLGRGRRKARVGDRGGWQEMESWELRARVPAMGAFTEELIKRRATQKNSLFLGHPKGLGPCHHRAMAEDSQLWLGPLCPLMRGSIVSLTVHPPASVMPAIAPVPYPAAQRPQIQ